MSNPIFGNNKPPVNNNPLNELLNLMNNGGDIQPIVSQLMSNGNMSQGIQQVKNIVGSRDPKEFALQLAKQQGIDINQLMKLANKFNIK